MTKSTEPNYEQDILQRLAEAGAAGLNIGQLNLPSANTQKGTAYRQALQQLQKRGDVTNLGSKERPRFLLTQYFQPLEMAYTHIETLSRQNGIKLGSKSSLTNKLNSTIKQKGDEALKLLVQEGKLIKLYHGRNPVYLHISALPQLQSAPSTAPSAAAILKAYKETVAEFGYPDVRIHEVFLRLGGNLEAFKTALKHACQEGKAVASVGDWSLSSPEERNAALYINGSPHLRIRFKE